MINKVSSGRIVKSTLERDRDATLQVDVPAIQVWPRVLHQVSNSLGAAIADFDEYTKTQARITINKASFFTTPIPFAHAPLRAYA